MDITIRIWSHSDSIEAYFNASYSGKLLWYCYANNVFYCIVKICLHCTLYSSDFILDKISKSQRMLHISNIQFTS
jgi:hypothetical protein